LQSTVINSAQTTSIVYFYVLFFKAITVCDSKFDLLVCQS